MLEGIMALTESRICDCGSEKKLSPNGLLVCLHCDQNVCTGAPCKACEAYKEGVIKRVILRAYNGA